ncbi:MAG: Bug family tripartite tricarboxylate transporter substrate binding protein [Alphaproteobacteria bacterium]|jgi:tripartite-type tricarboxylate transporter receptor subunit TctC
MKFGNVLATAITAGALAFGALSATAADYPSKTVKAIVPFGAGGGTDRWARVLSSVAFDVMDVGWHIQNRGGAAGTVGWKYMMDQAADGHSILLASPTPVIAALQETKPPFNPSEVKVAAYYSIMKPTLVGPKGEEYSTWEGLVKYAKAGGKKLTVGGTITQLLGAANVFSQAGIDAIYVPYSGTGKAVNDFLGGHVKLVMVTTSTATTLTDRGSVLMNTSSRAYDKKSGDALGNPPRADELGFIGYNPPRFIAMHPDTTVEQATAMGVKIGGMLETKSVKRLIGKLGEEIFFVGYPEAQKLYEETVAQSKEAMKLLQ